MTESRGTLAVAPVPDQEQPARAPDGRLSVPACWVVSSERGSAAEPDRLTRLAAERRVERIFESFGMMRSRRRDLVIANCLARAIGRWRDGADADLARLARAEAEDALGRWFAFVLGDEVIGERAPLLVGRVAFELCEGPVCWSRLLLIFDQLPPPFVDAMRAAVVPLTPEEAPGTMIAQPMEPWSLRDLLTGWRALGRSAAPAA